MANNAFSILETIQTRYQKFEKFLKYPGDWGERAFRGWLVFELFHNYLKWPIKNIIFGERFDVLLIDNEIKPIINIETKKPMRGLMEYDQFKKCLNDYQTLNHAILTDGNEWLFFNCLDKTEVKYNISEGIDSFEKHLKPFWAKRYLYGDV